MDGVNQEKIFLSSYWVYEISKMKPNGTIWKDKKSLFKK